MFVDFLKHSAADDDCSQHRRCQWRGLAPATVVLLQFMGIGTTASRPSPDPFQQTFSPEPETYCR